MSRPDWWCSLHEEGLNAIGSEWVRLRSFTDRPEVARDLEHLKLIESRPKAVGRGEVREYRRIQP